MVEKYQPSFFNCRLVAGKEQLIIAAMAKARAIVRYGIGVDNVDLGAAQAHGIPVSNIPDYCIDEVADHTLRISADSSASDASARSGARKSVPRVANRQV